MRSKPPKPEATPIGRTDHAILILKYAAPEVSFGRRAAGSDAAPALKTCSRNSLLDSKRQNRRKGERQ
jgi:hypothetical protein